MALTLETYIVVTQKISENSLTELLLNKNAAILPNQRLYRRGLKAWGISSLSYGDFIISIYHCTKRVCIRSFIGPYFLESRLITELNKVVTISLKKLNIPALNLKHPTF